MCHPVVCIPCGGVDKGYFEPTPVSHFGEDAELGDVPWQVALSEETGDSILSERFCGGTLINSDWVLTAAQCTQGFVEKSIINMTFFLHKYPTALQK